MFCEVRLDGRSNLELCADRNVLRPQRQHQRLPGVEEWRHTWRKRLTDAQILALIRAIHAELRGTYGSPRVVCELRQRGFIAGKERVEHHMRENGIRAVHKRHYKISTDAKHGLPAEENLLYRNFTPHTPN